MTKSSAILETQGAKEIDADLSSTRLIYRFLFGNWCHIGELFVCLFVFLFCLFIHWYSLIYWQPFFFVKQAVFLISSSGLQCHSVMGLFFNNES